ncbi:MAG: thioredoxin domain-containing protein, partial [Candidatus Sungbacteria bacterium]|nr:thioredoxin domain-containing protein [Candidatus Sungbacteria bacterium]
MGTIIKSMKHNHLIPAAIILSGVIISVAIFYSGSNGDSPRSLTAGIASPEKSTSPAGIETTDADPVMGNPDAPVTIIAFEDFECPFCRRFSEGTLPLLVEREIKEGKTKLVWKDFPLSIHAHAETAHEASRCAWEQGKFWEYHDVLFSQNKLGINDLKR